MSTLSAPSLDRRRHGTASGRHAAASSYQSSYQRNMRPIGLSVAAGDFDGDTVTDRPSAPRSGPRSTTSAPGSMPAR
jgi:hypothetical protein